MNINLIAIQLFLSISWEYLSRDELNNFKNHYLKIKSSFFVILSKNFRIASTVFSVKYISQAF